LGRSSEPPCAPLHTPAADPSCSILQPTSDDRLSPKRAAARIGRLWTLVPVYQSLRLLNCLCIRYGLCLRCFMPVAVGCQDGEWEVPGPTRAPELIRPLWDRQTSYLARESVWQARGKQAVITRRLHTLVPQPLEQIPDGQAKSSRRLLWYQKPRRMIVASFGPVVYEHNVSITTCSGREMTCALVFVVTCRTGVPRKPWVLVVACGARGVRGTAARGPPNASTT